MTAGDIFVDTDVREMEWTRLEHPATEYYVEWRMEFH